MILKTVQVKEFKSVWDSGEFEITDITCLVGKNEAGKTAILQALYRLNPFIPSDGGFDVTDDYPRSQVVDYQYAIENGDREVAEPITVSFELEDAEVQPIIEKFGPKALTSKLLRKSHNYNSETYCIEVDEEKALEFMLNEADLESNLQKELRQKTTFSTAVQLLKEQQQTSELSGLLTMLQEVANDDTFGHHIYKHYITPYIPKFLYFDDFYQMKGIENIEALQKRILEKKLNKSDYPLLGLIRRARLNLAELVNPDRTQELKNKLQGAGNYINRQVLNYWSQNQHIELSFDARSATSGDPEGMRTGTNIWAEIFDTRHKVTNEIGTRSKGFVWFFSFVAWYSDIKNENLILLLDEPGLSLHGRAQADLLKYFEAEIKDHHQLIYTTHLPFMVDTRHFERLRIVQDKGIDSADPLPIEQEGTKVHNDILEATADSLFPIEGAMGFDLYQSLLTGPNTLVVEGKSDLIYLQTLSVILMHEGGEPLSPLWTIVPTGGDRRIYTMAPLLATQNNLNVAVLIDFQTKYKDLIELLFQSKRINRDHVITYADFLSQEEAGIEDFFDVSFYLDLINQEYKKELKQAISVEDLNSKIPRVHGKLTDYFKSNPLANNAIFSNYRPARYFSQNLSSLKGPSKKNFFSNYRPARYFSQNKSTLKIPSKKTLETCEVLFKKLNSLL